jgi:DNA polymerase-3 subunit gamma/tau
VAGSAQSLYRKHRPRSFEDVVGQDPVVRTLRNAVERGKVHHAYLFVGSRGTGKTSMAKILASCLNCERGPTVHPCGQCDSCRSIAGATSLDVIEMDAASNNSVEDIRELRESVVFAPVSGRHKVYILDEAHMLSQAAWNAFLKTLEEPPPGTVFVLATTEAQKVPATVVDRCHRFDFHRPTVEQIASVLLRTAEAESIDIPPEAIAAIARSATGSFRDALGTLEQLVTYSGREIALQDVLAVLGIADEQLLTGAFEAIQAGDARGALLTVARCVDSGRDASSFIRDLEGRARELLIVQTLGEVPPELSLTPEIDQRLRAQAQSVGRAEVVRALDLLGGALEAVRAGADPRTQLELALVKAATPQADGSTRALLTRIERLEQALTQVSASVAPGSVAHESVAVAFDAAATREEPAAATGGVEARDGGVEARDGGVEARDGGVEARDGVDGQTVNGVEAVAAEPKVVGSSSPARIADPPSPEPSPASDVEGDDVSETAGASVPLAPATPMPVDDFDALWPAVLESVRAEHKLLRAFFSEAAPASLTEDELTIAFPASAAFNKRKAEEPANRKILLDTLRRLTGRRYSVSFELSEDAPFPGDSERETLTEEEIVARLMSELDAEELPDEQLAQQKGD